MYLDIDIDIINIKFNKLDNNIHDIHKISPNHQALLSSS